MKSVYSKKQKAFIKKFGLPKKLFKCSSGHQLAYLNAPCVNKDCPENAENIIKQLGVKKDINFTVLNKVIKELKKGKHLDDEKITYHPKNYKFKIQEYHNLFEALESKGKHDNCTGMFTEYRQYFEYKELKFIWRLIHGQGSACQLLTLSSESKDWPSKEHPMKFKEEKKIVLKIGKQIDKI